ncbi:tRNA-specific adenosine deaminase 2 isoform X6 [Aedes aegypti]|uniref:CMP/dCMP-type deaminase domain-containing protein n=1 Tax=Aedes aegypti TaxID=7159 RepID=A0A6I8U742_AEDAE|nr:tRNA-specific adenosine deaminase 2 isoform X6 [Aedes aegypti]XP_021694026.1 tRNA-specific adenosine deaminase 2 isoform X6 [Aedes aegypti]
MCVCVCLQPNMDHFMEQALEQARKAEQLKEVPVGCVFVYRGEIIANGCNLVNETKNATRHVEFICIDQVLEYCKSRSLKHEDVFREVTVVVTVEPYIMCAAALIELNVREVIYGCENDRFGGCTVLDVPGLLKTSIPIRGGVRADEAMELLKEFYKGENPSAPVPKVKR